MEKIKHRIFLGIVTGLVASIPGRMFNEVEHKLGLTDMKYEEIAASLFTSQNSIHSPRTRRSHA